MLEIIESSLAVIQRAQDAEGDGQDDSVEGYLLRTVGGGKRHCETTVAVVCNRGHAPVQLDGAGREAVRNGDRQLLVATDDVVALVRATDSVSPCKDKLKR